MWDPGNGFSANLQVTPPLPQVGMASENVYFIYYQRLILMKQALRPRACKIPIVKVAACCLS
ncbi:hypothetical protein GXY_02641 [Novacetimonas hansenii ATCC 23769]|uniref:Uncharacterized protein n=1 Tax=Novacetimonas hansenii ATCC 23769 TaxID=714995 RepID=D5QBN4_NOVHA|nr:hypothetical protein GXY_02641 [Novacetimonas hansenii ATCC 23769]